MNVKGWMSKTLVQLVMLYGSNDENAQVHPRKTWAVQHQKSGNCVES